MTVLLPVCRLVFVVPVFLTVRVATKYVIHSNPLAYLLFFNPSLNISLIFCFPCFVSKSFVVISPLNIAVITPIYASPKAVVSADAVAPEIMPPTRIPIPGINFNKPETNAFPANVAPLVPIIDDINVTNTALEMSNPKIAVIEASIVTSVGTKSAASEKGIGIAPAAAAAAAPAATAA